MVVDYPGLRRRAPRGVEVNLPDPPLQPSAAAATTAAAAPAAPHRRRYKVSQIYCILSLIVAALAICTGGSSGNNNNSNNMHQQYANNNNPVSPQEAFFARLFGGSSKVVVEPPPHPKPKRAPAWIRWALPKEEEPEIVPVRTSIWRMDPSILNPHPGTLTDLLDKILTSTPRLLAIANLLLSITYLVHTGVANLFLDLPSLSRESWSGRERLGGFLVFKLLLISAVVAPDTLDLLILLSWYTLLSFLRSLAGLAAATTAHTSQSGQAPRPGVLSLLLLVLLSDLAAASICVALFHGAGWGMVLLLTCDCALLAVDAVSHVLRHLQQTMDLSHTALIQRLEATQVQLHTRQRDVREATASPSQETMTSTTEEATTTTTTTTEHEHHQDDDEAILEESRQLDQRMERMEAQHNRRLSALETAVFCLQLLAYTLTVAHFLHIWTLHGLQFTLIDGVLALHLHSALSAAGKKIAERRNLNRIARDLDVTFEDATEMELAKSTDVFCCICLGTMSTGSVKKVACGHLYHTHCLREVVERARSMEAAKCPLCRASVLSGEPPEGPPEDVPTANGGGEHALFRFSTEGILPAWLPLPAFSFEVVRRPPTETTNTAAAGTAAGTDATTNNTTTADGTTTTTTTTTAAQPRQQSQTPSLFRRLLILAGVATMSAEEEAAALEQLVDMFPQYDRADLLRELRNSGSPEGVVEVVLLGAFTGVVRGQAQTVQVQDETTAAAEAAGQTGTVAMVPPATDAVVH